MRLFAPFAAAVAAIILLAVGSLASLQSWKTSNDLVAHTHRVREALGDALLMAINAEDGERGFLITGREEYLEPYRLGVDGLPRALDRVEELTRDNPEQERRLVEMRQVLSERLQLLADGVAAVRSGEADKAQAIVFTSRGKELMDRARALLRSTLWSAASCSALS